MKKTTKKKTAKKAAAKKVEVAPGVERVEHDGYCQPITTAEQRDPEGNWTVSDVTMTTFDLDEMKDDFVIGTQVKAPSKPRNGALSIGGFSDGATAEVIAFDHTQSDLPLKIQMRWSNGHASDLQVNVFWARAVRDFLNSIDLGDEA